MGEIMDMDTKALLALNSLLILIVGYFLRRAFERIETRLDRQSTCMNEVSNTLSKIQVWESFVTEQLKELKDRIEGYDADRLQFYKDYKEPLDFIKRNANALVTVINRCPNNSFNGINNTNNN